VDDVDIQAVVTLSPAALILFAIVTSCLQRRSKLLYSPIVTVQKSHLRVGLSDGPHFWSDQVGLKAFAYFSQLIAQKGCIHLWIQWIAMIGVLIIVCIGLAAIYGSYRWQSDTDRLRAKLTGGRQKIKPLIYDPKEIEDLPAPVQRFFRTVLKDGQAIVAAVKLSQQGQFNMSETEAKWSPFTAT
jgi:hypothetical protein